LADKKLSAAVEALERGLSRAGRHMLIGGVAVIARGVRRLTDDVDMALWADGVDLQTVLRGLAAQDIRPRIDDALAFARRSQVLLLRHGASGIDIDLSLAWLPFEREALDRADLIAIGRRRVRVATPDDLIIYKAIAARERDLSDIQRLIELHGASVDFTRVRGIVVELASALERPELVQALDRIVAAEWGPTRAAPKRRARKRPVRKR